MCLATTCHDPRGAFAPGVLASAAVLRDDVAAVVVNRTEETSPVTVAALDRALPGHRARRHRAGSVGIGTARRDALALALETDCTHVMYSDLDHVLRWAAADADELRATLAADVDVDLLVVGRSPAAFAAEPARLRATEGPVNRVAALALGAGNDWWDLMIAVRLMTRETARLLVEECAEESIGNDVAWPLHAHQRGLRLAHRAVDALAYRHSDDFGSAEDGRDDDPLEWISRLEIAALHARAMRPYLAQ